MIKRIQIKIFRTKENFDDGIKIKFCRIIWPIISQNLIFQRFISVDLSCSIFNDPWFPVRNDNFDKVITLIFHCILKSPNKYLIRFMLWFCKIDLIYKRRCSMAPPSCVTLIGQSTSDLNFVIQLESRITAVYRYPWRWLNSTSLIDFKIKVNNKNHFLWKS